MPILLYIFHRTLKNKYFFTRKKVVVYIKIVLKKLYWKKKTRKIKSFSGEKSKRKKNTTFSYNLPDESYEKKSSYEVGISDYGVE